MAVQKAMFQGELEAIEAVAMHLKGLSFERDGTGFWIWGAPLALGSTQAHWRDRLDAFTRKANTLVALSSPSLAAIYATGAIQIVDGDRRDHVLLADPIFIEIIYPPITLSARGRKPTQRLFADRAAELCESDPQFEQAANILAECGDNVARLYMAMEHIELAHGGFPPKKKAAQRRAFCERLGVSEADWEALHRTARPHRHAKPHEDWGPTMTPRQMRHLIQHALKLWLEREVPA